MIRSSRSRSSNSSCISFAHAIIILLLVLIGLFLVYMFMNNNVEAFQSAEGKKPVNVTYYHLPGCKFCRDFNPEWEKFVSMSNGFAVTQKVDGSVDTVPPHVKGFPHIDFLVNGQREVYNGERTANALMDKVRSYN